MKDELNLSISIEDINSLLKKYIGSEREIIVVKLEHKDKEQEIVPWNIEVYETPGLVSYKWKCTNCGYSERMTIYNAYNFCPRCGQQKREYPRKERCCCDE